MKSLFPSHLKCNSYILVPPAPPSFLAIPSSVILPATGLSFTFSCSVTGSPIPSITWLHNNDVISNDDSITITTQEQLVNTTLTIANIQQSDIGDYHCRAENNGGSITSDPGTLQIASKLTFLLRLLLAQENLIMIHIYCQT